MKKDSEYITIADRRIRYETKELNIFELEYYLGNPRVGSAVSQYPHPVTQNIIEDELWKLDSVKDLFRDIMKAGGLIEEIIVRENRVIEGNSRLCAYRRLYKKATTDKERERWKKIRAKVIIEEIGEEEIFILLGTYHLKGKAEWEPYEKAAYVHKMIGSLNKTVKDVHDMFPSWSENDIQSDLDSYKVMGKENIEKRRFSYFKEYFKNSELQKIRKKDQNLDKKFVDWVRNDEIPRAELVRELPGILGDRKVGPKFEKGILDFEECLSEVQKRHPDLIRGREASIYKHLKRMRKILQKAKIPKIREEIRKNSNKKSIVEYFIKEAGRFADNLGMIRKYRGR